MIPYKIVAKKMFLIRVENFTVITILEVEILPCMYAETDVQQP